MPALHYNDGRQFDVMLVLMLLQKTVIEVVY